MTGIYDTHHYNYRCRDCGYEAKVEDIVVDSFPPSPRSKHRMPELQCFCGGDLCYVKDSLKSAPKVRYVQMPKMS